jgi:hypothetical protein
MKLKVGDTVDYHSIIGGPVTSTGHEIKEILLMPNNFGRDVAWVTKKAGCVALEALTKAGNAIIGKTDRE